MKYFPTAATTETLEATGTEDSGKWMLAKKFVNFWKNCPS